MPKSWKVFLAFEVYKRLCGLFSSRFRNHEKSSILDFDLKSWFCVSGMQLLFSSKSHLHFWDEFLGPSSSSSLLLLDDLDKIGKTVEGLGSRWTSLLQGRHKDDTLLGTGDEREEEVDEDGEPAVLQPVQLLLLHQHLAPLLLLLLRLPGLGGVCVQSGVSLES